MVINLAYVSLRRSQYTGGQKIIRLQLFEWWCSYWAGVDKSLGITVIIIGCVATVVRQLSGVSNTRPPHRHTALLTAHRLN